MTVTFCPCNAYIFKFFLYYSNISSPCLISEIGLKIIWKWRYGYVKVVCSVWQLCCFEHWEKGIGSLLMESLVCLFLWVFLFLFFSHLVSVLADWVTEDSWILPAWVTTMQGKVLLKITVLFFFCMDKIPVQKSLCLELVGGHLLWEIREPYCSPYHLFVSRAVWEYVSAVPQPIQLFPRLHALGSFLSCDRWWVMDGGGDWSPPSHQAPFVPVWARYGWKRPGRTSRQPP